MRNSPPTGDASRLWRVSASRCRGRRSFPRQARGLGDAAPLLDLARLEAGEVIGRAGRGDEAEAERVSPAFLAVEHGADLAVQPRPTIAGGTRAGAKTATQEAKS